MVIKECQQLRDFPIASYRHPLDSDAAGDRKCRNLPGRQRTGVEIHPLFLLL